MPAIPSKSANSAKERGAFFTPLPIARFLTRWAIRGATDHVLEPSCGDAGFLLAAADRLGDFPQTTLFAKPKLVGVEMHAPSIDDAKERLRNSDVDVAFIHSNFFDVPPTPSFDAVVGNPPFIRYQAFSGGARTKALKAALGAGVNLNGLASSWAAFVAYASRFLSANGRMALVLPAELLTVKYAGPVRSFLLRRFRKVSLIVFEELVFPEALEDVVLLMAEGTGGCDCFEVRQLRNAAELEHAPTNTSPSLSIPPDSKWTQALVDHSAWTSYVTALESFDTLRDWGTTYLGSVTGDNDFFCMTAQEVADCGLAHNDVVSISPPGSRHLRGLTFGLGAWAELKAEGRRTYLFYPSARKLSKAAKAYIAHGEKRGVHHAYKCRVRTPWYKVPLVSRADLLFTYMDQDRPRLVGNAARVYHLNSLYGILLRAGRKKLGTELLPVAALNTLTLLGGEVVGRSYGGGLLKVEPREADHLPMPPLKLVESAANSLRGLQPQLATHLRQGDFLSAASHVDKVLLVDSGLLDAHSLARIRDAHAFLYLRRAARAKKS